MSLLKKVVVSYPTYMANETFTQCKEYSADTDKGQYLTVHNTNEGQLVVNVCHKDSQRTICDALAVYNRNAWNSWDIVEAVEKE